MNGYGLKRTAAKRRRRLRKRGIDYMIQAATADLQPDDYAIMAPHGADHVHVFTRAHPHARCKTCGDTQEAIFGRGTGFFGPARVIDTTRADRETLEAQYGRGSQLVEVILAQQAGYQWGPYDAARDPGRLA